MHWHKRDIWKAGIALTGLLVFLVLMVWIPLSAADAHTGESGLAIAGIVQATPTVDLTVTALAKEQLVLQNKQLEQSNDRGLGAWVWNNAAAIVASFLSTLVVVIGALIAFWQWRTNRNDTLTKESNDRKEAQDKDLRTQAEERFQAAVTALGSENEATQVGGAILLRSFLHEEDKNLYGRYYTQIFDLAVAYLRVTRPPIELPLPGQPTNPSRPLFPPFPTPLGQALAVVFKEAFPLAKNQQKMHHPSFLDATSIELDWAYLKEAKLIQVWMPSAHLRHADLSRADLTEANLRGADLDSADLTNAKLGKADLREASLIVADLQGADLQGADLSWADLSRASLGGANLSRADLTWADLSRDEICGVDIEYAQSLQDANLHMVKGLTKEQLEACKARGAIVDKDTMNNAFEPTV
jgi:uncharacterized protein YjbI with pentapeptide repeats